MASADGSSSTLFFWVASRICFSPFLISSSARPPMIYDYGGFPPHTYAVQYPAPGEPVLAERVQALLQDAGQRAVLDPARGFDHGTFTLMYPIYPEARVPVVQLSLKRGYDPRKVLEEWQEFALLADTMNLIFDSDPRKVSRGGQVQSQDPGSLDAEPGKTPPDPSQA